MKKIIFMTFIGFTFASAHAQQVADALQYAQDDINGTARFRAMGGAFGALGGDLSALNVNPAGSAIFTTNFAAITLSNQNKKNKLVCK